MYVDLLSFTDQTVQVEFLTNAGQFAEELVLTASVRTTVDVNASLFRPGQPLAGRTDIDVSVRVTSSQAVHVRCPVYFSRSDGAVKTDGVLLEMPDHH